MSLFFRPVGRLNNTDKGPVVQDRQIFERVLTELEDQSLAVVLQFVTDIYIQGVHEGLDWHDTDQDVDYQSVQLQNVWLGQNRGRNLFQRVVKALNQADSFEFYIMSEAITKVVMASNDVQQISDLESLSRIILKQEDLFEIFLSGWIFGKQSYYYQSNLDRFGMDDDAAIFDHAMKQASDEANQLGYTEFDDDETQAYFMACILNVLE